MLRSDDAVYRVLSTLYLLATSCDHTESDYTKPDHIESDQAEPNYTEPDYTEPDHTEPDYLGPDHTVLILHAHHTPTIKELKHPHRIE